MADPTGRTTSTYSPRNNLSTVTNPDAKTITYAYDTVGRRSAMTDPDGGRFTYAYDPAGNLTSLLNPQSERTSLAYDPLGREIQKLLANGNLTMIVIGVRAPLVISVDVGGVLG